MAMTANDYKIAMLSLLPQGPAWPRDENSWWAKQFEWAAIEFALIDAANEKLLLEMSPYSCTDTLPEWEQDFDLPGPCIQYEQTFTERRNALIEKYSRVGDQSAQMFIDAAAKLGYTITITEYDANNPGPQSDYNGIPLLGDAWNYVWQINGPETTVQQRTCGALCGEPLSTWGNELLECTMWSLVHDHRVLFFSYGG